MSEQLVIYGIFMSIDASITDTPRKPRGKKEYEAVEDRNETDCQEKPSLQEKIKPNVDKDARWVKKAGKLSFRIQTTYSSISQCTSLCSYYSLVHR